MSNQTIQHSSETQSLPNIYIQFLSIVFRYVRIFTPISVLHYIWHKCLAPEHQDWRLSGHKLSSVISKLLQNQEHRCVCTTATTFGAWANRVCANASVCPHMCFSWPESTVCVNKALSWASIKPLSTQCLSFSETLSDGNLLLLPQFNVPAISWWREREKEGLNGPL